MINTSNCRDFYWSLRSFQMFFFKESFSQAKTNRTPARPELLWSSRVSLTTHQPSTRQCCDCEDRQFFLCVFWPLIQVYYINVFYRGILGVFKIEGRISPSPKRSRSKNWPGVWVWSNSSCFDNFSVNQHHRIYISMMVNNMSKIYKWSNIDLTYICIFFQ